MQRLSSTAVLLLIAPNPQVREQLFGKNTLRRLTGEEAAKAKENNLGAAPEWFASKAATEYDIWVFEGEPDRNFRMLIDKTSGAIFLSDYQV